MFKKVIMKKKQQFPPISISGLDERPDWWRVRVDEIMTDCAAATRGRKEVIAETPGGYPVYALFYGDFSEVSRESNWSAASASGEVFRYNGNPARQTVLWISGIHGAEPESVAYAMNLIRLLEHGADWRGERDEELLTLLDSYNLIVVPCVNMDGRAISPDHLRDASFEDFRRASLGVWADGSLIGWKGSKALFPLPLDRVAYPGGYPNSEGYNIMYDATPGDIRTAEARALLQLIGRYGVDLVINAHSCEFEPLLLGPDECNYRDLERTGWRLFDVVNAELFDRGLRKEPLPPRKLGRCTNFNSLVPLVSGGATVTLECTVTGLSFEELLEVNGVTLRCALKEGLKEPFADRAKLR